MFKSILRLLGTILIAVAFAFVLIMCVGERTKVSGHSISSVTSTEMYTREITNATKAYGPSNGTSKIGLMYASDKRS